MDRETGMYYYGARYYDPRISIFVSVDPLAEKYPNYTPYHYVHQNPINMIDPTGMEAEKLNPIYGLDGKYLGNTKEGFTGDIIIYNGNKDKSFFGNMTADEFLNHEDVINDGFLLDDVIDEVSDKALSKIFTSIAESFEGYDGFKMSTIGNEVKYKEGRFNFQAEYVRGKGEGEIFGNRSYVKSYESTVENIGLTIVKHEWRGHMMNDYHDDDKNHNKAYKAVIDDPKFNQTTEKFQKYNQRRYKTYYENENP